MRPGNTHLSNSSHLVRLMFWGMGGATTTVETYTEGTIVADLFDAQTKKVVWRGAATKEVSNKPEKVTQQVEKAIDKLFKNYPPATP